MNIFYLYSLFSICSAYQIRHRLCTCLVQFPSTFKKCSNQYIFLSNSFSLLQCYDNRSVALKFFLFSNKSTSRHRNEVFRIHSESYSIELLINIQVLKCILMTTSSKSNRKIDLNKKYILLVTSKAAHCNNMCLSYINLTVIKITDILISPLL